MRTLKETAKKLKIEPEVLIQAAVVKLLEQSEIEQVKAVQRLTELQVQRINGTR